MANCCYEHCSRELLLSDQVVYDPSSLGFYCSEICARLDIIPRTGLPFCAAGLEHLTLAGAWYKRLISPETDGIG